MTDREKLQKAQKKMWKLLSKLYNEGYLVSLGFENCGYNFSFRHGRLHPPKKKIKE